MGGDNSNENLVRFTFREHFVAHWLLIKFTTGPAKCKMQYALHRMCHAKPEGVISGWQYTIVKQARKDAGVSDEAKRKLSETQKARGPTKRLLEHLARLNARFKAEGGEHWKRMARIGAKKPPTEKQLAVWAALPTRSLKGPRSATPRVRAHLERLAEKNRNHRTEAQMRQLISIQQAPKTERQKEAFRRSHKLPRSVKQMAQIKSIQGLRWSKHREAQ